jgi:hypothetical protein
MAAFLLIGALILVAVAFLFASAARGNARRTHSRMDSGSDSYADSGPSLWTSMDAASSMHSDASCSVGDSAFGGDCGGGDSGGGGGD